MKKRLSWYGAKCIFIHPGLQVKKGSQVYEERVIILRARDEDEAIALAEKEARQYAKDISPTKYLGFIDVFHLYAAPREMSEVYSLMRESRLDPETYLDRFFDTGRERSRKTKCVADKK